MYIYAASSWRNKFYDAIVSELETQTQHTYYNFKRDGGFSWADIDPLWETWTEEKYIAALDSTPAKMGYSYDYNALNKADAGVLILPCGKSAHLEAGYLIGQGKPVYILLDTVNKNEPELMYKLSGKIFTNLNSLVEVLNSV